MMASNRAIFTQVCDFFGEKVGRKVEYFRNVEANTELEELKSRLNFLKFKF